MVKAIERGADVGGGTPFAEWIDEDSRRHTDLVFEIARRFDRDGQAASPLTTSRRSPRGTTRTPRG